jgi:hypothetical protein
VEIAGSVLNEQKRNRRERKDANTIGKQMKRIGKSNEKVHGKDGKLLIVTFRTLFGCLGHLIY